MKKIVIYFLVLFLAILFVASVCFSAGDHAKGKTVYEAFCTNCHGVKGGGDGPEAASLNPKPTKLTDSTVTAELTRQDIERAVVMGKPGTAMKGFGGILTKDDIESLLAYVNGLMGK